MPTKKPTVPDAGSEVKESIGNEAVLEMFSELKNSIRNLDTKFDEINSKFDSMSKTMAEQQMQIDELTAQLADYTVKLNDREQHSRSFSVRIFNLKLDKDIASDSMKTATHIYETVLKPILNHAVNTNLIPEVPEMLSLIEHCHVVPDRQSKNTTPVIVRFQCRLMRNVILKTKKSVLPKIEALKGISIAEDLTVINYQKLQGLLKKNIKAWSLGGKIMYMDKDGTKKIAK